MIDGAEYLPSRRHHTMATLIDELAAHGIRIVYSATEGDVDGLRVIAQLL